MNNSFRQSLLASLVVLAVAPAHAAPVVRPVAANNDQGIGQGINEDVLPKLVGEHNLHLYFGDTKPFLDVIEIFDDCPRRTFCRPFYAGVMKVPDDFDAQMIFVELTETRFVFDVMVPRNRSRPKDLVFRYEVMYRNGDYSNGAGLVHIVAEGGDAVTVPKPVTPRYVGSFVLFRKADARIPSRSQQPLRRR